MPKVTVYYFKKFDIKTGQMEHSKRPATLETITFIEGEPIKETAHEVDASELDGNGFVRSQSSSD
jgi:hypothetical protein